uniref:Uncharacterized protein n=1 Tax=viral metagenome TaxID=1070528 RepID=A0A6M3JWS6_9ZZZZ
MRMISSTELWIWRIVTIFLLIFSLIIYNRSGSDQFVLEGIDLVETNAKQIHKLHLINAENTRLIGGNLQLIELLTAKLK